MINNLQQGVSLYLALMIMTLILAISLGISTILVSQIKMIRGMGDSIMAFYAADTGIERALSEGQVVSGNLENGASYNVQVLLPGPDCSGQNYCLKSVGVFRETRRAIEITR